MNTIPLCIPKSFPLADCHQQMRIVRLLQGQAYWNYGNPARYVQLVCKDLENLSKYPP